VFALELLMSEFLGLPKLEPAWPSETLNDKTDHLVVDLVQEVQVFFLVHLCPLNLPKDLQLLLYPSLQALVVKLVITAWID